MRSHVSIYGESSNQFRPRPAGWVLVSFTLFSTLIGLALGPLLYSFARTLVTRALRSDYLLNIHAPIGANPAIGLFPLHSNHIVIGALIAVAVVAVLTTAFIAVYPASQTLSSRLALHSIGTATLASGAIATTADLGLLRSLSRWKEISEIASGGTLAGVVLVLLFVVVWLERRMVSLLGNLFETGNPLQRLGLWALRVPLPWTGFGVAAFLSDWWGGIIAAAGVLAATFVDNLVHYPNLRYETLEHPKMYEGLAAAVITAVILGGCSALAFGFPAARLAPKAVVLEAGKVSIVRVSDLTNRIYEQTMPRIDMKWSSDK